MNFFSLKHKYTISLVLIAALSATALSNVFAAKKNEYTGTVVPLVTNEFSWGWNDFYRGKVLYAPMPGDILFGPITNVKGETVRPGDYLIKVNKEYRESIYLSAVAKSEGQEANFDNAKVVAERDSGLVKTNAISELQFDTDYNTAQTAYQSLLSDKSTAIMDKDMLEYIEFKTQFDCIVNTVYCPFGLLAGENNVLQISQISPIGVNVELDPNIADNVTDDTPITIYPIRDDKPIGAFRGRTRETGKGLIFEVDNYCMIPEEDGCTPVDKYDYVLYYSTNPSQNKQLAVPVDSIMQDEKGYYVCKAMTPNTASTEIEKVYVKPADTVRKITPQVKFQALDDAGGLNVYDIVLLKDAGKIENNKVALYNREMLFMPGDKVKVVIGQ